MAPESCDIDNALVAKLGADAALLALCPNGVYFDESPPGATRFVLVSIGDAFDLETYDGRSGESVTYAVKAVMMKGANGDVKAAAARIDELLTDQPLTVSGYTWSSMARDADDPRIRYTERDDHDETILFYHRGGNYRVEMARTETRGTRGHEPTRA